MKNKINIDSRPKEVSFYGDQIRLEAEQGDNKLHIWSTIGQMPLYGRLDITIRQAKELAEILPEFIKAVETE